MNDTAQHTISFFLIAFASGLLYPVFYAVIGAPAKFPHPSVPEFPGVQILAISKPSMIFRAYGAWLSRKQNEFEFEHDKSLISVFALDVDEKDYSKTKPIFSTSYGRSAPLHTIPAMWSKSVGIEVVSSLLKNENRTWEVIVKTLPGETCAIEFTHRSSKRVTDYSIPLHPDFNRAKMPLSPYKALGLCGVCTVFWITFLFLSISAIAGIFPPWYFVFIPLAYGIAVWSSSLYEV